MWLSGKRTGASFTYTPLPPARSGAPRLRDEVTFRAGGKERRIAGVDTLLTGRPGTVYRWRGSGLLAPLSSVWEVGHLSADGAWALITFSRSPLTPAGTDVVIRAGHAGDPEVVAAARAAGERAGTQEVPGWDSTG